MRAPEPNELLPAPPHSAEAEQSVLGALLTDNAAAQCIDGLDAGDFYVGTHRELFGTITQLIAAGTPADAITLVEALKARGQLERVGGADYVVDLIDKAPSQANIRHHVRIVREKSLLRQAAALGNDAAAAALSPGAPAAAVLLDDIREKIDELAFNGAGAREIEPLDLGALAAHAVPEREFIVGMIAPKGKPGGVTGHGAAGKTQVALGLDICFAAHVPFFGEPTAAAIAAHVSSEEDRTELHIRIAAQCNAFGIELSAVAGRLFLYDFTAIDPTLVAVDREGRVVPTRRYAWLKGELRRRRVEVLTLDNFATLCAIDVIKPGHATHAIALLDALLPPGGNVIILGHVDKATARAGYGKEAYSGTTAIHNRLRWRWYLFAPARAEDAEPGEETTEDDGRRILEVQKNNGGPSGQRILLRIRHEDGALVADGVQTGIVASIQRNNERKAVLEAVAQAAARGVPVPTATTNRATAYEALEAMPAYPDGLRGKTGKRRLFRLLMQMRADGDVATCEFRTAGRKSREGYAVAPIQGQLQ